jgi:hypothetical protein
MKEELFEELLKAIETGPPIIATEEEREDKRELYQRKVLVMLCVMFWIV